jgi:hypothetical protein
MVDGNHRKSPVEQRFPHRLESHLLHIIGKPGATVDQDHHFIFSLSSIGQINIEFMSLQTVISIVDISPLRNLSERHE